MRKVALFLLGLSFLAPVCAQDWGSCHEIDFRDKLGSIVTKGNEQYDRSFRQGIKLYADSLLLLLNLRHEAGNLTKNDSLEFTAHYYKLMGDWYYEDGNYNSESFEKAEDYFNKALYIFKNNRAFEYNLSAAPIIHRELAQLYYRLGDYEKALANTQIAFDEYEIAYQQGYLDAEDVQTYFDLLSQIAMCNARMGNITEAIKQIEELEGSFAVGTEGYFEAKRKKGKILMLGGKAGCEKQALPLYKEYLKFRKADALKMLTAMTSVERQDYWMRIRPFIADCYQTENADPAFLYDVTLFAKGLLLHLSQPKYDWRQIQAKLAKDACAIEFVQYEKDGEQKMAALLLKKTGVPQWVEMMSPKEFFGYENKLYGKTVEERIYSESPSTMEMKNLKNGLFNDSTLFAQIWNERLRNLIKGCRKVYFAPDGYLHQIAVEYMIPEELSSAQFFRLTSTRRLMEKGGLRNDAAMIVGGVNYQIASSVGATPGDNDQSAYNNLKSQSGRFGRLSNSAVECDSILMTRACQRDTLLVGSNVTEAMFRELCNRYPIINISTHGLFCSAAIPQGTDIKPCLTDESLSQSLLAMAGINGSLDNEHFNPAAYDGILSAGEMASLDMSNVDLVVLSACQSGMGYVTSDGVFGMQRGLKNAGVGSIVASLWSVSDNATCRLMIRFHQNLRLGLSLHNAFMMARASLMVVDDDDVDTAASPRSFSNGRLVGGSQRNNVETYDEPYFYNAFILIDALE